MEPFVLASSVVAIFLLVSYLLFRHRPPQPADRLPGPSLLEFLPNGLLYPLLRDSRTFCRVFNALSKEYGDIYAARLGLDRIVVTAVPEDIAHIFSSKADFPRPKKFTVLFETVAPGGIFTMPRELHAVARRTLRENFNTSMLRSFHAEMTEAVAELCASLEEKTRIKPSQTVDISELLAITTFRVITNVAFGFAMSREDRLALADITNAFIEEMMADFLRYPMRQWLTPFGVRRGLFEGKRKIDEMCFGFIKSRLEETEQQKKGRHPDILDTILSLEQRHLKTVSSLTLEFALAGSITTNQTLAWCIYETCCNARVSAEIEKEVTERCRDRPLDEPITLEDMKSLRYVHKVWKETCRLRPISVGGIRSTARDITLKGSGIRVPKGTLVLAHSYRAMRSPDLWTDPLTFRPERWGTDSDMQEVDRLPLGAYIPFGIGSTSCAGRFLADYEGPLILAELHRRFKFTLGCHPSDVISCSCFVETARCACVNGGEVDMGVPVRIQLRSS